MSLSLFDLAVSDNSLSVFFVCVYIIKPLCMCYIGPKGSDFKGSTASCDIASLWMCYEYSKVSHFKLSITGHYIKCQ